MEVGKARALHGDQTESGQLSTQRKSQSALRAAHQGEWAQALCQGGAETQSPLGYEDGAAALTALQGDSNTLTPTGTFKMSSQPDLFIVKVWFPF